MMLALLGYIIRAYQERFGPFVTKSTTATLNFFIRLPLINAGSLSPFIHSLGAFHLPINRPYIIWSGYFLFAYIIRKKSCQKDVSLRAKLEMGMIPFIIFGLWSFLFPHHLYILGDGPDPTYGPFSKLV
jgi:hypothetical protein